MNPSKIKLSKENGQLELSYANNQQFTLSGEFLRVHSPSAEVRGHGAEQAVLQYGKKEVKVTGLERAGNYGLKITFSDGHDTGIYTWKYLYELGENRESLWQQYLDKLAAAGKHRQADTQVVQLIDPSDK